MQDLGTLAGPDVNLYSIARAINDAGQIVGEAQTTAGFDHAFLYSAG